jgi:predicted CopG family antitoxin
MSYKRNKRVIARVTKEEYDKLQEAIKRDKTSISKLIRELLKKYIKNTKDVIQ